LSRDRVGIGNGRGKEEIVEYLESIGAKSGKELITEPEV